VLSKLRCTTQPEQQNPIHQKKGMREPTSVDTWPEGPVLQRQSATTISFKPKKGKEKNALRCSEVQVCVGEVEYPAEN
jgi:hypothetical protein